MSTTHRYTDRAEALRDLPRYANLLGTWAVVLDFGTDAYYLLDEAAEQDLVGDDEDLDNWLRDALGAGYRCQDAGVEDAYDVEPGAPTGEPADLDLVRGLARIAVERELARPDR